MLLVYVATVFVSAFLLFLVQPMFARMVLPLLGGSPAVWNTALVFYQAILLLGYGYAHVSTRWLGVRRQAGLHLVLLLLPLPLLPIALPRGWVPPTNTDPTGWLLLVLLVAVGVPFFAVSATSPLLQRWFGATGHRSAADPYFLYAASNVGSLLALVGYPVLVEPFLPLPLQSRLWAGGYGLLVVLMAGCGLFVRRTERASHGDQAGLIGRNASPIAKIANHRRLRWVVLSLVPSSLMLSVTTYLSTDVAAIPLLWVIPLGLYLLTFIFVFAKRPPLPHPVLVRALPIVVLPLVLVLALRATEPLVPLVALNLAAFWVVALVCHGELARDRPPAEHVTEFYLWMSLGGTLGGVFNALIAPLVFNGIVEYPLTLVLACLLLPRGFAGPDPGKRPEQQQRWMDVAFPLGLSLLILGLIALVGALRLPFGSLARAIVFGPSVLTCFFFSPRPIRFALGVAAVLLAGGTLGGNGPDTNHGFTQRSFFGVHRVTVDTKTGFRQLSHGHTIHGAQSLDPARRDEPLTYYARSGPIGQLFAHRPVRSDGAVGVVGLGAGTLAAYGRAGQRWTFYEIDPLVVHIARSGRFFTYLPSCAADTRVVLGDARLGLAQTKETYDVLVLDAYSSDAIPMHLLTREALRLYLNRLAPGGVLSFHISNRHLDLEPVLAGLAEDAGLVCRVRNDDSLTTQDREEGKTTSEWVVLARSEADLGPLAQDTRWVRARSRPGLAVWTDNYSSLLHVFTNR